MKGSGMPNFPKYKLTSTNIDIVIKKLAFSGILILLRATSTPNFSCKISK